MVRNEQNLLANSLLCMLGLCLVSVATGPGVALAQTSEQANLPAETADQSVPATQIESAEPSVDSAPKTPATNQEDIAASQKAQALVGARALSLAFRNSAAHALPSVVRIMTRTRTENQTDGDAIRDSLETATKFDSVGSGVIITSDGLVLTNHHVIADADLIEVQLPDGRRFRAQETRSDANNDLATLRIDGKNLPTAELGDSDSLFVGDWVLAIGSPFTLSSSVSAGIISGTNRYSTLSKSVHGQFLQTDAAINPGNSGGPLIDLEGRVVGICTAISSRNGGSQGIGFAIPIRRAQWVMRELEEFGRVRRGYAGVGTTAVPYSVASQLELPVGAGSFVNILRPGRPAAKAGLKRGDVIVEFDGHRISSNSDLAEFIQQTPIGEPTEFTILRAGERITLSIELEERQ